jgi:hypothetical protein
VAFCTNVINKNIFEKINYFYLKDEIIDWKVFNSMFMINSAMCHILWNILKSLECQIIKGCQGAITIIWAIISANLSYSNRLVGYGAFAHTIGGLGKNNIQHS